MNLIKKLISAPQSRGKFLQFSVICRRCGEIIHGQVNINNEPSLESGEKEKPFYTCRKVLIGSGHCFERIEVIFKFDEDRRVIDKQINGGEFVDD